AFDRAGTKLAFTREGAHSRNRVLHAHGDSTGREIVRTLAQRAGLSERISFRTFSAVTDIVMQDGETAGVAAFEEAARRSVLIEARAVLLATGGLGHVFENTTNPDVATGDGVACGYRAGAAIQDIEFVQFHPTALYLPSAPRFLLSEALRGEGGYLRNARGERFMECCHPLKELAPRDVVSRSIVMELRASGDAAVFLDLTHLPRGFVQKRFPRIYETCLRYGIDLETTPAPVRPAAHYAMGGIQTDLWGRTNIPRLYAAGEAACTGVHGANRLASNSLLEGVVFGARAGEAMRSAGAVSSQQGAACPQPCFTEISEQELRSLAWNSCGILRSGAELQAAYTDLHSRPCGELSPSLAAFELRNMCQVALLIAFAALHREESRGGHYRTDFPAKSAAFEKHSVLRRAHSDRDPEISFV
ncbi:MAG TPA: FAD-binding protein, partial [Acidobacteriaceae bacterium]|nr:FAD-binding protein [Acidobacteriaceae bacterium]